MMIEFSHNYRRFVMDRVKVARELVKIAKSLTGMMTDKAVKKYIDKVNKEIARSNRDEVQAVEPDSTWESVYEFKPIRLQGKNVIFQYKDVYENKVEKDKFNYTIDDNGDLAWQFKWVLRAIKKGYKQAR